MPFNLFGWALRLLADRLVDRSAGGVVGFLNSEPGEHSGAWAEFKYARSAMRDGDLEQAAKLTKGELEKEPENYEGLMLLASIYAQMGRYTQAVRTLDNLQKCRTLTDGQVEVVQKTRDGYLELMKVS